MKAEVALEVFKALPKAEQDRYIEMLRLKRPALKGKRLVPSRLHIREDLIKKLGLIKIE